MSAKSAKSAMLLTTSSLLLAGCQQFDTPDMANMGGLERESYVAIRDYFLCMAPFAKSAKLGPKLTDNQVNNFGYRRECLPALHEAAIHRERYFATLPDHHRDPAFSAPTQAQRVKLQERDLARSFWCHFRFCYYA